jgi:transposase
MYESELAMYEEALDLVHPWQIVDRHFSKEAGRLDMFLKVDTNSTFTCSVCNTDGQRFYDLDQGDQTWRHMDFFQYKAYLHAPHPRVDCTVCGKVKYALVPWSRYNCSFTLEFEKYVLSLVKEMPVNAAARIVREHDTRLWRIVHFYVDKALANQDLSAVKRIAVDETSSRRGHKYVTIVLDSDERKVIFATEGKGSDTIRAFKEHLEQHQGEPGQIEEYCSDMSPAFIGGMTKEFPDAELTVDKFHVMKLINDAVDEVRREEQREQPELKKSRYLWLRNPRDLKQGQQEKLKTLSQMNLATGRAYRLKLAFQDLWSIPALYTDLYLKKWYQWALHSRIPQIVQMTETIRKHEQAILHWFKTKMTNGLIEAINGIIQAAKRKARGFRTVRNLLAVIYLIGGKLNIQVS